MRGCAGRFRRAIVIGPAHYVPFQGIAAPSHDALLTPLGEVTDFDTHRIGNALQTWEYPAPAGWVASC